MRRVIAVVTLGGSVQGLYYLLKQASQIDDRLVLVFFVACIAYLFWGVWAGVLMLESKGTDAQQALYFWLLQIPVLFSSVLSFQVSIAANLAVYFNFSNGTIVALAQSGMNLRWVVMNDLQPFALGVNILAVLICVLLYVDDWRWLTAADEETDR